MTKEGIIIIGALLLVFGFLGHVVPYGEFGSVTDIDELCSSLLGQVGQSMNAQARENCQVVSILSKIVYSMMGIGVVLIIIGAVMPSKKRSLFLCGECDQAFSTEAELYNHGKSKGHLEKMPEFRNDDVRKIEDLKQDDFSYKDSLKKSPTLQGVIVGIVAVVIFWGIFSLFFSQTFYMANDALSPDIMQGDLMHYQRTPFSEIKINDIIAFIPSDKEEFSAKVGIVRVVLPERYVQTSSNANPNTMSTVFEKDYVGKISSVTSQGEMLILVYTAPYNLLITVILFVTPIIVLRLKKR